MESKRGDGVDSNNLQKNIEFIRNGIGNSSFLVVKNFYIGKSKVIDAAVIYINALANKEVIDKEILKPLMLKGEDDICKQSKIADYVCKRYITSSNTCVEVDGNKMLDMVKRGKTLLLIDGIVEGIIVDTTGGNYRAINEPINESVIKGPREGFIENLETNISMIRRKIKDRNLTIETLIVGKRSQTDVSILYIDDIVDKKLVEDIKNRIQAIDIDGPVSAGELEQYIETHTYTVFPQTYATERVDVSAAKIIEGKILILTEGAPVSISLPVTLIDFFQAVDDYNQRSLVSSFVRILRLLAIFVVITLPSIYLTLIKYNVELIPIKFVTPIVQSRIGIALTPFLEIIAMEITVEFLREGGLRLPNKIAQTLSLVGGIIIGDTAIKSKIVSPSTLLVVGITVIATFLIPNYDMSLAIRILRFPMLILANIMGIFGIAVGWFVIMVHLFSLDSFGVPYLEFHKEDMKDIFIRAPLWRMNERPKSIPNTNPIRQTDFRSKFIKKENDEDEK